MLVWEVEVSDARSGGGGSGGGMGEDDPMWWLAADASAEDDNRGEIRLDGAKGRRRATVVDAGFTLRR